MSKRKKQTPGPHASPRVAFRVSPRLAEEIRKAGCAKVRRIIAVGLGMPTEHEVRAPHRPKREK